MQVFDQQVGLARLGAEQILHFAQRFRIHAPALGRLPLALARSALDGDGNNWVIHIQILFLTTLAGQRDKRPPRFLSLFEEHSSFLQR